MKMRYAQSGSKPLRPRPDGTVRTVALLLVLGAVVVTAVRVEVLNARAGGFLPSRELHSDTGTPVRWRLRPWTTESLWRATLGPKDANSVPVARPLTELEHAQMVEDTHRARANNALRDVVSTWGLVQYLLIPLALFLSPLLLFDRDLPRRMRLLGSVGIILGLAAGGLMMQRAYMASLGW